MDISKKILVVAALVVAGASVHAEQPASATPAGQDASVEQKKEQAPVAKPAAHVPAAQEATKDDEQMNEKESKELEDFLKNLENQVKEQEETAKSNPDAAK